MDGFTKNISTFSDYGTQAQELERQRKMAELMQQQAMQPVAPVSQGAPISWTQGLAKMLQAYSGRVGQDQALEKQKALTGQARTEAQNWVTGLPQGTPAVPEQYTGEGIDELYTPGQAAKAPSRQEMLIKAMEGASSGNPMISPMAGAMLAQYMKPQEMKAGNPGDVLFDPNSGQVGGTLPGQRFAPPPPVLPKTPTPKAPGTTRDVRIGNELVTQELKEDGSWAEIGRGPAFAKQVPSTVITQPRIPSGYRQAPDGNLEAIPGGPADKPQKAMPASAAQKLLENKQNLRIAEQALEKVTGKAPEGDKEATGWKGFLPDFVLQRTDPEGVATRAALADLGSMIIHDRSGAAVTAAEFPRLRPFIPTVTDDAATAQKKLDRFVKEFRAVVDEAEGFYRDSGYNVPTGGRGGGAPTRITGDADYNALPKGALYVGPDGVTRTK